MNEHIGHFSLWGDFEVADVTSLLGIEPSQVFLKGDVMEGASAPAVSSTWDLHCPDVSGGSMSEQIAALLGILWPKKEAIKQLTCRFQAELNVASTCEDGSSVLSVSHEQLQQLVELHVRLNCFYLCEESNGN